MNKLFENFKKVFGVKILLLIAGVFSSVYLSRILQPDGKGIYATSMAVSGILSQFFNFGFHSSHTYYISRNKHYAPLCEGNTLVLLFVMLIICCISAVICILTKHTVSLSAVCFFISLASSPFALFNMLQKNIFLAIRRVNLYNIFELLNSFFCLLLIFIASTILYANVNVIIVSALISEVIVAFASLLCFYYTSGRKIQFSIVFIKKVLPYGLKSYIASFINFLILRIDIIMLTRFVQKNQIGLYSLATNIADLLCMVTSSATLVLFPELSSISDMNKKNDTFVKIYLYTVPIAIVTGLIIEITCGMFIPIVYGHSYIDSVPVLRVLVFASLFWGMASFNFTYLASENDLIPTIWIPCIALGINILFNFVLIKSIGVIGAAYASLISYAVVFLGSLFFVLYRTRINQKNVK